MIDRIYDLLLGALARLYMTIDELKWRRLRGLAQRGTRSVRYFNANGGAWPLATRTGPRTVVRPMTGNDPRDEQKQTPERVLWANFFLAGRPNPGIWLA